MPYLSKKGQKKLPGYCLMSSQPALEEVGKGGTLHSLPEWFCSLVVVLFLPVVALFRFTTTCLHAAKGFSTFKGKPFVHNWHKILPVFRTSLSITKSLMIGSSFSLICSGSACRYVPSGRAGKAWKGWKGKTMFKVCKQFCQPIPQECSSVPKVRFNNTPTVFTHEVECIAYEKIARSHTRRTPHPSVQGQILVTPEKQSSVHSRCKQWSNQCFRKVPVRLWSRPCRTTWPVLHKVPEET